MYHLYAPEESEETQLVNVNGVKMYRDTFNRGDRVVYIAEEPCSSDTDVKILPGQTGTVAVVDPDFPEDPWVEWDGVPGMYHHMGRYIVRPQR